MTATRCPSYFPSYGSPDPDPVCQLDAGHAGDHRDGNIFWTTDTAAPPAPPTTGPVNLTAGQLYTDHRYDGPAVRHVRVIGGMKLDPPALVESVRLTTSWGQWTPLDDDEVGRLEPDLEHSVGGGPDGHGDEVDS